MGERREQGIDWQELGCATAADNTIRAWRADWRMFSEFCHRVRVDALPASAASVLAFIEDCVLHQKQLATIERYLTTIKRVHGARSHPDPTAAAPVREARRVRQGEAGRALRVAGALSWLQITRFLGMAPRTLRDYRDRALLAVAYETSCSGVELVSVEIADLELAGERGAVRMRHSRRGRRELHVELSPPTVAALKAWLAAAALTDGRLFVNIRGASTLGRSLTPQSLAAIHRTAGRRLGLDKAEYSALNGRSAHAGAAQDLCEARRHATSTESTIYL